MPVFLLPLSSPLRTITNLASLSDLIAPAAPKQLERSIVDPYVSLNPGVSIKYNSVNPIY